MGVLPCGLSWLISDSAADFAATAALFLGKDISDRVERVAIENY